MKLEIKNVAMKNLNSELRRRRGTLIDALCEELLIMDRSVEHEPLIKQRELRRPNDYLTERITVDGIAMEVKVRASLVDGSLMNRLELRYGFVDPETDRVVSFAFVREPKGGFDIISLTQRFMRKVNNGAIIQVRLAILDQAQDAADHINNAFGASPANFLVRARSHIGDEDFGPLEVSFQGLCSHLVVKLIKVIIQAHENDGCGGEEPVRNALERRANTTPKSELN